MNRAISFALPERRLRSGWRIRGFFAILVG